MTEKERKIISFLAEKILELAEYREIYSYKDIQKLQDIADNMKRPCEIDFKKCRETYSRILGYDIDKY